ncbi:MAG TPA: HDOD domain-containing protein [Magnetospirillaceae bacterium]|nr:HDOD domain-containing protein [Magnetospirillaceae bacterium]
MTADDLAVDVAKITKAVHNAIPLTITTYTFPHEIEIYLEEVLEIFLGELGQKKLKDYLIYCLRELAVNAKKANTKRVYFESRNLSITDPSDYEEGMKTFKVDTLENLSWYLSKQKAKGYYVKIVLQAKGSTVILEVRNNVEINRAEYLRIHDKLARARRYTTLEDALQQVLDPSEGAGLGLVILVLMLKKIGLDEDCFDIRAQNGETMARISVPVEATRVESVSKLTGEIVRQITALPHFPENIVAVQKLLADPRSEMLDIARHISTDPAITADLLKLVNSAQFMLPRRVDNIVDAVKLVGLKGIRNLLYSYGAQKLLGDDTDRKKKLWEHSYRCAYYAYNLVKNFKPAKRNILDDAYVGGMLHDMGKIVFSAVHPELLERLRTFCGDKGIPVKTFEDIAGGMNHAEIGARIAEKWNFPDPLVAAIRFHHDPAHVTTDFKDVVFAVYLANAFTAIETGGITWDQLDPLVIRDYGFQGEAQFRKLVEQFGEGFIKETRKLYGETVRKV